MGACAEPTQFASLLPDSTTHLLLAADAAAGKAAYDPPTPSHILQVVTGSSSENEDDDDEHHDWHALYGLQHLHVGVEPSAHDPRDEGTADAWVERHPSLVRLTGKHPFNGEPPLARLMQHGIITPAPLHYVRNHGPVPRGADWATWAVEVAGLVRRPARLTVDDLAQGFPALELPVTLVCSSNRRKEQNTVRQTLGFNWGAGAVSTSVWRGARLRDVLRRCGVAPAGAGALYVCFEGAEDLPGGGGGSKYGTSISRERALDPTMDVMLAYMQNGAPLLPDHGYPVRLIVPGCTAGRMVKWLKRIVVTTAESDNYYHYRDNRFLPSHVDVELADAEAHDDILPINATTTNRAYTVKGFAYSGAGKKVTRVELTLNGGQTWLLCALNHPEKPTKYGKYWCWCFWSADVEVADLVGSKEIAVRAWDQSLNTQPENLTWNLMGMMTNCWFKVKVSVCRPRKGAEIGLVFEHPVQPGNQSGGWMAPQKHLEVAAEAATATPPPAGLHRSTSAFTTNTAADDANNQLLTMSEVHEHASRDSAWIVVHGHVYDCTEYLNDHPGGADSILINAGADCTEEFDAIHSDKAQALLDAYRIGDLVTTTAPGTEDTSHIHESAVAAALSSPREKVWCRLIDKKALSRDVRLLRFALPSPGQVLGLPVGKHILVCADIDGELCMRAYTPTSAADEAGHFDLLVKVYFKNENPMFPAGGRMTQHLDSLPLGAGVDVKGPLGHVEYVGRGSFVVDGKPRPRKASRVAMVAGGSGITPMYQVIQAVMRDQPEDRTEMHLVYASRTDDDILLRDELDRWAAEHPGRLKVWYVIGQVKRPEEGWRYSVGIVTEDVLREHLPEGGGDDALALVCGPQLMIQFAVLPNLEKMKYHISDSVI
ncbi:hypothetical protein U9M48_022962, partial [Paspalum notatum var. saurae]